MHTFHPERGVVRDLLVVDLHNNRNGMSAVEIQIKNYQSQGNSFWG